MRNIKFRGKNITTGEWVYGCLVNNLWTYSELHSLYGQNVCDIIVSGEVDGYDDLEDKELVVTVDPSTLGQFTNRLDKNGKEIWEGDIVSWTRNEWVGLGTSDEKWSEVTSIGKIVFLDTGFWVDKESMGWEGEELWNWDKLMVIGNVFENPELIKQEEQDEKS